MKNKELFNEFMKYYIYNFLGKEKKMGKNKKNYGKRGKKPDKSNDQLGENASNELIPEKYQNSQNINKNS